MKTKVFTLILFALVGLSTTYAGKPAAELFYEKLTQSIQYPDQAVKAGIEGFVDVVFVINDEGFIVVKSTDSSAPELEKYVKEKISTIKCSGIKCIYNEHFKVRFVFKLS